MTKKFSKRLKLFLLTATVFSTVALGVSCSGSQADLTVGVRSEDIDFWEPIVADFEAATGKTVSLISVQDMNNDYQLWKGTGIIPNVTIADAGVANRGIHQDGWFQPLDLNNIISSEFVVDEANQGTNIALNEQYFLMSQINAALDTDTNMYNMMPMIYGPELLYFWNKDNSGKNTMDGSVDLDLWIPNANTNGLDNVSKNATANSAAYEITHKADGSKFKNTQEDIQAFLLNSIRKSQSDNIDLANNIYSIGNSGFLQRLYSVIASIFLAKDSAGKSVYDFQAGALSDGDLTFGSIAEGRYLETKNKNDIFIDATKSALDDSKWLIKDDANTANSDAYYQGPTQLNKDTLTKLQKKQWFSKQGYFNNKLLADAIDFAEEGRQTPFAQRKGMAMLGAKWQFPGITAVAKNQGIDIKDLSAFFVPIQTAGVDGYAISKDTGGEQLTLAKQFIRFMVEPKQAARMAANKAVSTIKAAVAQQQTEKTLIDEATITNASQELIAVDGNDKDLIDFITTVLLKKSTEGQFDRINNLINAEVPGYFRPKGGRTTISIENWARRINEINQTIENQQNQG